MAKRPTNFVSKAAIPKIDASEILVASRLSKLCRGLSAAWCLVMSLEESGCRPPGFFMDRMAVTNCLAVGWDILFSCVRPNA